MGVIGEILSGENIEVVICGGGHVGFELEKLCGFMGYDITVLENRSDMADKARFPYSQIRVGDYKTLIRDYEYDNAYYVIVTPDHAYDTECLIEILNKKYSYVGMIGSRKKVAKCMEMLTEKGYEERELKTVHAPIGVDISSVTPKEIAVSILAEIIKIRNENPPKYFVDTQDKEKLKNKTGKVVCAVICDKRGSAPRGKGACIFLCQSGELIGTVGGGKWEADIVSDMRKIFNGDIKFDKKTYTSHDEGALCGGEIDVLFEIDEI